jgi:hypothetical protein
MKKFTDKKEKEMCAFSRFFTFAKRFQPTFCMGVDTNVKFFEIFPYRSRVFLQALKLNSHIRAKKMKKDFYKFVFGFNFCL